MTDWSNCPAVERKPGKISGAWAFTGTRVPVYARRQGVVVSTVQPRVERRRAGNPPNPDRLAIAYLRREVLPRRSLTNILENYAQVVEAKDEKSGRKRRTQIWPRLPPTRRGAPAAGKRGRPRRRPALPDPALGRHSAGSGKSNSIAWLAHQLIGLTRDDAPVFDSIIVVTDRVILDRQIRDTIRQYAEVGRPSGTPRARAICAGSSRAARRSSARAAAPARPWRRLCRAAGEVGEPRLSLIVPVVLSGEWGRGAAPGPAYRLPVLRTIRLPCESGRCVLPLSAVARKFGDVLSRAELQSVAGIEP